MKLSSHGNGKLERKNKLLLFFCVCAFSVNEKFIVLLALMPYALMPRMPTVPSYLSQLWEVFC